MRQGSLLLGLGLGLASRPRPARPSNRRPAGAAGGLPMMTASGATGSWSSDEGCCTRYVQLTGAVRLLMEVATSSACCSVSG